MSLAVRLDDIKSVLDELARLNAEKDGPFAGKLDMNRIAVAGHSLGGVTALLGAERDTRIHAAVIIDGWPNSLPKTTKTPVLILAAGHNEWSEIEQHLWDQLTGPRIAINLKGTEHVTPTDAVWLARDAIKTGGMGPEKTVAAIRDYIAAFLDAYLRGQSTSPLLNGWSSEFPDAEVTTRLQSLRARRNDH